jgi:hypothetical protein
MIPVYVSGTRTPLRAHTTDRTRSHGRLGMSGCADVGPGGWGWGGGGRLRGRLVAWLSLFWPSWSAYLAFFQNCYQGFVLANYFLLLQQCLGGRAGLVRLIGEKPPQKRGRFCWCLWHRPDRTFDKPYSVYLSYKRRSMQFVAVMPTIGVATVILGAIGKWDPASFDPSNAFLWLSIIHIVRCRPRARMCIGSDHVPRRA